MEFLTYNAKTEELEETEIENRETLLKEFYGIIGCRLTERVTVTEDIDVYVDEEGLIKNPEFLNIVTVNGYEMTLFGNMIFTSWTEDGYITGLNEEQKAFIRNNVKIEKITKAEYLERH